MQHHEHFVRGLPVDFDWATYRDVRDIERTFRDAAVDFLERCRATQSRDIGTEDFVSLLLGFFRSQLSCGDNRRRHGKRSRFGSERLRAEHDSHCFVYERLNIVFCAGGEIAHRHYRYPVVRRQADEGIEAQVPARVQHKPSSLLLGDEPTDSFFHTDSLNDGPPHRLDRFPLQDAMSVQLAPIKIDEGPAAHVLNT